MSEVVMQGDEFVPVYENILTAMARLSEQRKIAPRVVRISPAEFGYLMRQRGGGGPWWEVRSLDDPTSIRMLTCLGHVSVEPDPAITKQAEMRFDDPTGTEILEKDFDRIEVGTDRRVARIRSNAYAQSMTIDIEDIPALLVALDWIQEQCK